MKILLITSVIFLTACSEHEVKPVMPPEKNEPTPVEQVIEQAIEIDQAIAEPEPIQEAEPVELVVEEPEAPEVTEEPEEVEVAEPEIDQPVTEVVENETE